MLFSILKGVTFKGKKKLPMVQHICSRLRHGVFNVKTHYSCIAFAFDDIDTNILGVCDYYNEFETVFRGPIFWRFLFLPPI